MKKLGKWMLNYLVAYPLLWGLMGTLEVIGFAFHVIQRIRTWLRKGKSG